METKKQIRIKDIAAKAKVSIGTVDRVLHNRGEVSEETKAKILEIVKEMNYQPNILASTLASKKSAIFATLFPEPPSPEGYWNKPVIGVNKRIMELRQYGLQVHPFPFIHAESASFVTNAQRIIDLKPDGVILAPIYKKETLHFIEKLKDLNIPFVFIDSEIKDAGHIGYIGQNSYQSGLLSGKLLDLILPEGNILIAHFAKELDNQNHLAQREKGFYDWYYKNKRDIHQLITVEIPDAEKESWMQLLAQTITEKNIKGVFVTNSKAFLVCRMVEKYNISDLKIIGHDLLKENIYYLKKDLISFLICQRPEEQGYNAIDKLFRYVVQKRITAKENYTSIDIVTKENVDYYKEFKRDL